jgi:hypothetical protein
MASSVVVCFGALVSVIAVWKLRASQQERFLLAGQIGMSTTPTTRSPIAGEKPGSDHREQSRNWVDSWSWSLPVVVCCSF